MRVRVGVCGSTNRENDNCNLEYRMLCLERNNDLFVTIARGREPG